jgi:tripartite-type tricarboxylate transporter receptor subunit TctC
MQDMLAGTSHVMFANISDVLAQVKAGKLNAMAVTTAQRSSLVPDIPTLAESGYPGFSYATWQAVVGPAGLPREVVDRLNAEIRKIMAMPDVKAQFATFGTDVTTSSPEELGTLVADEVAKIKRVAVSVGATNN